MKKITKAVLSATLSGVLAAGCFIAPVAAMAQTLEDSAQISNSLEYAKGQALVVMDDAYEITLNTNKKVQREFSPLIKLDDSYTVGDGENKLEVTCVKSSVLSTKKLISKLNLNNKVKYVVPNYVLHTSAVSNDTYADFQWALDNSGQNGGTENADINAENMWAKSSSKDEKVVAVLDTGIDYTAKEFEGKIWQNPYGNKLLGKNGGVDLTGTVKDRSPADDNGHGTHVSGIIAANANNGEGISGVMKDTGNVKIMAVKWLDDAGEGYLEDSIAALDYVSRAKKLGANIIATNNSYGGYGDIAECEIYKDAFDALGEMGILNICAAGNDGEDIDELTKDAFFPGEEDGEDEQLFITPVQANSDYQINVAATGENGELSSYSTYNKDIVDVAAPGTNILSTVSYDCFNPTIYSQEKRDALCSVYQNYDKEVKENEAGYIKPLGDNPATIAYTDKHFGKSGKAIKISIPENCDKELFFEMPYSLENENDIYSLSLMAALKNIAVDIWDVPASSDPIAEGDNFEGTLFASYLSPFSDDSWDHLFADFDEIYMSGEIGYKKSTQRKLVFSLSALSNDGASITIDDLAISKQGVNTKEFEKYDFYSGTSMATPYVAGAVALLKNVYTDASPLWIKNMIINSGRKSASLENKVASGKTIDLTAPENVSPAIFDINYKNSKIEVTGVFKNLDSVSVNAKQLSPSEYTRTDTTLTLPLGTNNNRTVTVTVGNEYGTNSKSKKISSAANLSKVKSEGADSFFGATLMNAGKTAYSLSSDGSIGSLMYDNYDKMYYYEDFDSVTPAKIFENCEDIYCGSAAYMSGKIFFTAENAVYASTGAVLGYETKLAYYDTILEETVSVCDIPNDTTENSTLAVYGGNLYLIGGYDNAAGKYSTDIYKLDESKKSLVKAGSLAVGVASTKAVQYAGKLVLMYGENEAGTMPKIQIFDGKTTTVRESVNLTTDEYTETTHQNNTTGKLYDGSIGAYKDGVICHGSFIEGLGTTFTFNPTTGKVSPCAYKYGGEGTLSAVMLPQGFTFLEQFTENNGIYNLKVSPYLASVYVEDCDYADAECDTDSTFYGDKVRVFVTPANGYAVTGATASGKTYPFNEKEGCVYIPVNSAKVNVTVKTKKVAPNKVTGFKVSKTTSTTYTLSWKKVSKAQGYLIQKYVKGKWINVKNITNANTLSYKIKATAGTAKYRILAYAKYNGKNYFSPASKLNVYVPSKQNITSLKSGKKGFTVKFKKNKSASGYQIQYSTTSSFKSKKSVTLKGNKVCSKKVSSLKSKKKYYVRVRSYKSVNSQKVYGSWSKVKSVKTK